MNGRTPACLSDLRIDMWLARDLAPGDEEEARRHVDGCARCAARLARIEAGRTAAAPGARGLPGAAEEALARRPRAQGGWWRRWPRAAAAGVAGLAAAAAAVALVATRTPAPGDGDGGGAAAGVRSKGGARIGFFVKRSDRERGDDVRRGGPGETLAPGDTVRFTYTADAPGYLAVIGVDAGGVASVYFPTGAGAQEPLPAGQDLELPRATVLDETLGRETIHAFFCARPVDLDAVRRGTPPPGCTVDRLDWNKVRAQ